MSVQEPNRIDFISQDKGGAYWLNMTEERPWVDMPDNFADLKAKVNTYIGYVRQKHFQQDVPNYQGQPVGLRLICAEEPTPDALHLLSLMKAGCAHFGLQFSVMVVGLEGEPSREVDIPMGKISKR